MHYKERDCIAHSPYVIFHNCISIASFRELNDAMQDSDVLQAYIERFCVLQEYKGFLWVVCPLTPATAGAIADVKKDLTKGLTGMIAVNNGELPAGKYPEEVEFEVYLEFDDIL